MSTKNDIWTILKLQGTDKQLYSLIGPLVMNPKVLASNDNYAFRTTAKHTWYIALKGKTRVMGFLSVHGNTIGNDYVNGNMDVLDALLDQVIADRPANSELHYIASNQELPLMTKHGFIVKSTTANYNRVSKKIQ